jgi:hypothetical protein
MNRTAETRFSGRLASSSGALQPVSSIRFGAIGAYSGQRATLLRSRAPEFRARDQIPGRYLLRARRGMTSWPNPKRERLWTQFAFREIG